MSKNKNDSSHTSEKHKENQEPTDMNTENDELEIVGMESAEPEAQEEVAEKKASDGRGLTTNPT